jgi:uncharacterized membrane protein (DUF4010 family)
LLPALTLTIAIEAIASALLIGVLVGAQREAAGGAEHPGLRDFLLVSLAGGICGVLGNPWLDAAALLVIGAIFAVLHYEDRGKRSGITTELAAAATFLLALLAASYQYSFARPLAAGTAILVAVFLEARKRLQTLLRETITEQEFNGTLAFVAVVLVIYPLLPAGKYGPYEFFDPREVWKFVILISSISYAGYFFQKFLGEERGLIYTAMLGGLASTTAVTLQFAHLSKQIDENEEAGLWRAFVLANTVQFPRTFFIVAVVTPELALPLAWPLGVMTICGLALVEILRRWPHKKLTTLSLQSGNPFRIGPALRFGVLFTVIVFITRLSIAKLGTGAFYGTSLVGGLVDVATVIAPAENMLRTKAITMGVAEGAVLLALVSNAILKMVVALWGTRAYILRVVATFVLWSIAGVAAWWFAPAIFRP